MSGGSLNYFYCQLQDHARDFDDKELDNLVEDLADLFHDREWYLSSDTGYGSWREAKTKFKDKWFTEHGRQERIEKYLEEIRAEVLEAFGMDKRKCADCRHFTPPDTGRSYGECDLQEMRSVHRFEVCEKFEGHEVTPC